VGGIRGDPMSAALELWPGAPRALSWSQVSRHWSCSEKYRIGYRTEVAKLPSGAAMGGSAVHTAILAGELGGWWWNLTAREAAPLCEQAFGVAFAASLLGHDVEYDQVRGWVLIEGEPLAAPPRWGGRPTIVEEEALISDPKTGQPIRTMQKVQARSDEDLPLWRDRRYEGVVYAAPKPVERVNEKGRTLKDLALWVKAREDARWWFRNGPIMVKKAGALRRADIGAGIEVLADAVERRIEVEVKLDGIGSVRIVVVMDAALLSNVGERVIRDYKTGMGEPLQLAFYGWVLAQLEEAHPLYFPAEYGELVKLRKDTSEMLEGYDLRPWLPLIPGLLADHIRSVRREVEEDSFEIRPSSWCPSCDVRTWCRYGMTLPERED